MALRVCDWCGERYHEDDDWVNLGNGLIVCYPCSTRDVADDWAAGDEYDLAEESEWNDDAEQE